MYRSSISISDKGGQLVEYYKPIYNGQSRTIVMALDRLKWITSVVNNEIEIFSPEETTFLVSLLPETFIEPASLISTYLITKCSMISQVEASTFKINKTNLLKKLNSFSPAQHLSLVMKLEHLKAIA